MSRSLPLHTYYCLLIENLSWTEEGGQREDRGGPSGLGLVTCDQEIHAHVSIPGIVNYTGILSILADSDISILGF